MIYRQDFIIKMRQSHFTCYYLLTSIYTFTIYQYQIIIMLKITLAMALLSGHIICFQAPDPRLSGRNVLSLHSLTYSILYFETNPRNATQRAIQLAKVSRTLIYRHSGVFIVQEN